MKNTLRLPSNLRRSPIATSVLLALLAGQTAMVQAGSGWGAGYYVTNPAVTTPVQTYYANSPAGAVVDLKSGAGLPTLDPVSGLPLMRDSGVALRKFVNTLPGIPGLNSSGFLGQPNELGQVIPVAQAEKWVDAQGNKTDDYYEIAAVEFTQKMHSDLPKATRLRGYVQISTAANPGKHLPLNYPDGTPVLDSKGVQVYAHDAPSHLGPIIQATSGVPVRIKFTNYLPFGAGGNLFLPVDHTVTGAGTMPTAKGTTAYTENRAVMHLVGGQAPWVSGGSPHQWVAPAAEAVAYASGAGKGPSNQNVPDMPDPGPGSTTLYFPNAQSARFMFIQDRTSGLTRLNTYAGMGAGYLLTDTTEQGLVSSGTLPADQLPLVLEDKTFVPQNVDQQDALWDTAHWGSPGDLWFAHVYETNQAPNAVDGTNPVGRWDYGPWFWPIFPVTGKLPSGAYGDVTMTPEMYGDTPLVNGVAYPTVTVDPKAYRVRILNASNDRFYNLGWYKADPRVKAPVLDRNGNPTFDASGNQLFFLNTEVPMVPAIADTTGAPLTPSTVGAGLPYDPNCLCQYPNMLQLQPTIAFSGPTRAWPIDSRPGGAPDPTAVGPDFIAYGSDGGLLPAPVDVPSQPVTYESNRRSITVTNVYGYGMLVGPQERADTVVDFSAYAGQTLILYNDAPAPFPFNDRRNDYYTGSPDQSRQGGWYSTQPGYGPNTRTIMQVKVNAVATNPGPAFSADNLIAKLPAAYGASQPKPVVPESAYNTAFGTNDADTFAHVATGSVAQPQLTFTTSGANMSVASVNIISSGGQLVVGTNNIVGNPVPGTGTGYSATPSVTFENGACLAPGGTPARGVATVQNTAPAGSQPSYQVTGVRVTNPGSGYTCAPQITFGDPTGISPGIGAQAVAVMQTSGKKVTQSILVQTKAEQELFDTLGRYNQTGGVELPLTSGTTQTTIPLSYIDAPTEFICDAPTSPLAGYCQDSLTGNVMTSQIWKIVDNGFWTNSMHFSGFDVQLINRVGWDGTVKAPASNELGWKDTFRLNPLEDVILAIRPKTPPVPFGQPWSVRPLDPSVAIGAPGSNLGFMADPGVTAPNGAALLTTSVNISQNFGDEFYWGSALQGHSEDDLLRPVVFSRAEVRPQAATALALTSGVLTWKPAVPTSSVLKKGNPANEIGVRVNRYRVTDTSTLGVKTVIANLPANSVQFSDPTPPTGYDYAYTVTSWNNAGATESQPVIVHLLQPPLATAANGIVSLVWQNLNAGVTTSNYAVYRALVVNGVPQTYAQIAAGASITKNGGTFSINDSKVIRGASYSYQVKYTPTTGTPVTLTSNTLKVN